MSLSFADPNDQFVALEGPTDCFKLVDALHYILTEAYSPSPMTGKQSRSLSISLSFYLSCGY